MKTVQLNVRELAVLDQCLQFALSNIDDLEEVTDEEIEAEIIALKNKI